MQAKERFAARKARPERELVADDVEAALAREIAHLNAVTSQLSHKVISFVIRRYCILFHKYVVSLNA
jgi:hypothetical protein